MAVLSGTLYAAQRTNTRSEPTEKIDVTLQYGRMRYISDSYTIPTADELGTDAEIQFFKVPKGARILEMFFTAPQDASSSGQLNIGWEASEELDSDGDPLEAADPDGFYIGSSQADFGGGALSRLAIAATRPGYRKKFAAEVQVVGDVVEATTDSGDSELLLEAYIVVD